MSQKDSDVDYWSLTPTQLRQECMALAQAENSTVDAALRTEAGLLATQWGEAISMPEDHADKESRKNSEISALKHRTIEILLKQRGSE